MKNRRQYFILSLLLAFLCLISADCLAQNVSLEIETPNHGNKIEVGQKFWIKVTYRNWNKAIDATSPIRSAGGAEVLDWRFSYRMDNSTTVNGRTTGSSVEIYSATLIARKKGNYTLGPLTIGGVKTNQVKYSIVDASESRNNQGGRNNADHSASDPDADNAGNNSADPSSADPSQNSGPTFIGKGNDKLFMRASVSKTTAYEQEAIVYTVKLYTTYSSIKFIGATDAPKFEGFVIDESNAVSNSLVLEDYQGRTYKTAVIARYIIFPQMAGSLKVIGNKYTVSTDAYEYYNDPYFSQLVVRRPIQLNVTPNDLVVNVKPLPTPRPANFSGGVGKFTLSSALKTPKAIANQAGSITYTVSGEGNLKYVHLPDLNAIYPDEIEVFSPTTDVNANVDGSNVSGSIKFDYSFMPLEQGSFKIPEVELVYFNPATGQYETATAKGFNLEVARGKESSKSQVTLTFNSKLMPVDIDETPMKRPQIRGFLYWLWYIIPTVLLLAIVIARRKYLADRADVIGLRTRRAGKMARRRLKKAMVQMKSGNEDKFYEEILKAVWGYLSDKLQLPTSELSRDNVSQILESRGIGQDVTESLLKLIDECEFARYSPASLRKPMSAIYEETADMLNNLEEIFSKKSAANPKTDKNDDAGNDGSSSGNSASGVLTLILLVLSCFACAYATPSSANLIAQADSAYSKGEYEEAVSLYEQRIKNEGATAPILFNLGCAYYKSGNEGEARLCFERAKRLDPSDARINQNLNYIENRVEDANKAELKGKKGDVVPDNIGFFGRVNRKIAVDTSSNSWSSMAAMSFILMIIAIAGYIFSVNVRLKKIGFFSSIIFFGFTVIFIVFSEMAASHFMSKDEAVVTAFKVQLADEPTVASSEKSGVKSNDGVTLCRGTKLEILESRLDADGKIGWYKVELNHSNVGWVEASSITII